jgi:hypothetical protein
VVEERGAHALKGVPEPTALFRLVRASGGGRRSGMRQLTPLVGREEEMAMLMRRWERARQGDGQFVLIVGEPGIGKSHLIEEFHGRVIPRQVREHGRTDAPGGRVQDPSVLAPSLRPLPNMRKSLKQFRKTIASLIAPNSVAASIAILHRIGGSRQIQHFIRLSRTSSRDCPVGSAH